MKFFVAVIFLTLVSWSSASASEAGTVDIKKCEACNSMFDAFFNYLMRTFEKKKRERKGVVELKGDQMVLQVCDEMHKQPTLYSFASVQTCRTFLNEERPRILQTFANNFEINDSVDNFYQLRLKLCNSFAPFCVPPPPEKLTECEGCKMIVNDISQMFKWGEGKENHATKEHGFRVMDDFCPSLQSRHPIRFYHKLLEQCNDLIDEYSGSIATALAKHATDRSVAPVAEVCYKATGVCGKDEL